MYNYIIFFYYNVICEKRRIFDYKIVRKLGFLFRKVAELGVFIFGIPI